MNDVVVSHYLQSSIWIVARYEKRFRPLFSEALIIVWYTFRSLSYYWKISRIHISSNMHVINAWCFHLWKIWLCGWDSHQTSNPRTNLIPPSVFTRSRLDINLSISQETIDFHQKELYSRLPLAVKKDANANILLFLLGLTSLTHNIHTVDK